jgi:hypothetical protein
VQDVIERVIYTIYKMAENKKSFVLYTDLMQNIDHLTLKEKGVLFNHLLEYVNDLNPKLNNRIILSAWKPIERQLKRDLVKYETKKVQWSEAGKRSAEAKKAKKLSTESTYVNGRSIRSTESTVNDNVNVTVNDNVNDSDDVLRNIDTLFSEYKANKRLIDSVTSSQNINKDKLIVKLQEFNVHLKNQSRFSETWKEYTRYFLAWLKKQKPAKKNNIQF